VDDVWQMNLQTIQEQLGEDFIYVSKQGYGLPISNKGMVAKLRD
jgi:hypothetical protein